mmetsp:Transcript_17852/g.36657  ORF Transcript_17852/g.36657 Transcript_17852/m.36657 type:complete len:210 (+) Transcript_17852:1794-2423(+)
MREEEGAREANNGAETPLGAEEARVDVPPGQVAGDERAPVEDGHVQHAKGEGGQEDGVPHVLLHGHQSAALLPRVLEHRVARLGRLDEVLVEGLLVQDALALQAGRPAVHLAQDRVLDGPGEEVEERQHEHTEEGGGEAVAVEEVQEEADHPRRQHLAHEVDALQEDVHPRQEPAVLPRHHHHPVLLQRDSLHLVANLPEDPHWQERRV